MTKVVVAHEREAAVADIGRSAAGGVDGEVLYCSDEHLAFIPGEDSTFRVGECIRIRPAHCDPTAALHERYELVRGEEVVDEWPIDLRHW